MPDRTFRLTLEYDGSRYFGWQTQPDQPTVQQTIEEAIATIVGEHVSLHGSGRTDRGAHALAQTAHFRCGTELPPERMMAALNANLPEDIAVTGITEATEDFHARFSVQSKTYRYRILNRPVRSPLERRRAWWLAEPIDVARMQEGAAHLVGEHDFRAFVKDGSAGKPTVRRVIRMGIVREGPEVIVDVEATGFLYTMVRSFVGCLARVGRGDWDPAEIREILEGGDREKAGPNTAPAHGLYLLGVRYPPDGSQEEAGDRGGL